MLFALLLIFIERRNPTSTWAWLVILLILPGIGFVLYLFLGQNFHRQKMFELKTEEDVLHKRLLLQNDELIESRLVPNDEKIKRYLDMIRMNYTYSNSLYTQNNSVRIFTDGNTKFDSLFEDVKNATHHIHIGYYIYKPDKIGNDILEALIFKAKEGVKVRLLYDAMGGRTIGKHFFDRLKEAGGQVAIFFPSKIPHFNIRVNYRNHRKIVVIDGKIAYVGGFNIGDEYLGRSKKFGSWRDTHLRVCGEAVDGLQKRFLLDWRYASDEKIHFQQKYFRLKEQCGTTGIQIISSGPDSVEQEIKNGFLKMIQKAEKSIYIQSPYFVPDDSIIESLRIASLSGVDVRIMIPHMPDHPFVYWATYSYVGELLKSGVKSYKYNEGFLHSKTIVVDGEIASVGTANMDIRSFKLNFEVNAFIYDHEVSGKLHRIFLEDMKLCEEITEELYKNRSRIIQIKESISRLLSPIL
jgi:cardiolipin synthase